jgi:cytochrome subunit of sulfide dehydrogenase
MRYSSFKIYMGIMRIKKNINVGLSLSLGLCLCGISYATYAQVSTEVVSPASSASSASSASNIALPTTIENPNQEKQGNTINSNINSNTYIKSGQHLALACMACHSSTQLPNLYGMPMLVLKQKIQDYASSATKATIMHQLAKGYSDAQIESIAAYFSSAKQSTPTLKTKKGQ